MMVEERDLWWAARRELMRIKEMKGDKFDDLLAGSRCLAKLVGFEYPIAGYLDLIALTPELKRILLGIAGPNGPSIIKILELRGRQNDNN
jgi:hypothetical protein